MQVPVKNEHDQIQLLDLIEEAIYLQTDRSGGINIFTDYGIFTLIRRIGDWVALLDSSASMFLRVDRGTIVNLQKPWQYSPELRVLKLIADSKSIHIPVSEQKITQLIEMMNL